MTNENADTPEDQIPSHVDFKPLPTSRADIAREKKALRRVERNRTTPPLMMKTLGIILWPYILMRRHDPDYVERYQRWQEQKRREYDGGPM